MLWKCGKGFGYRARDHNSLRGSWIFPTASETLQNAQPETSCTIPGSRLLLWNFQGCFQRIEWRKNLEGYLYVIHLPPYFRPPEPHSGALPECATSRMGAILLHCLTMSRWKMTGEILIVPVGLALISITKTRDITCVFLGKGFVATDMDKTGQNGLRFINHLDVWSKSKLLCCFHPSEV